ncbi:uncharacterized protein N7483_002100 [Penicillium malachiteum]|uniref:uncharacterized protein n=1 Tax=Penicillium malachiteum TaxID=1324776 RepID=UPI0025468C08|nr:uncharacterized protein N7483_002100 [Penicillium malachiteum]KAJ5736975.1 hypothetical protein N7483_002100 [Penicillium malachiteum]
MTHMHTWWSQCVGRTDLSQANPEANYPTNKKCIDIPGDPYDTLLLPFGDMPTAALAALFDAANVIVFRLFFLVSPSAHLYENRIQQHIRSIFSALSFVSNMPQPISQRGYIMVALPIQIVRIWAPCNEGDDVTKLLQGTCGQELQFSAAPSEFFANIAAYIHSYYSIPEMTLP